MCILCNIRNGLLTASESDNKTNVPKKVDSYQKNRKSLKTSKNALYGPFEKRLILLQQLDYNLYTKWL